MARTVDLKQTISVNNNPMSIANIVKIFKSSKDIRFDKGNVIVGGRRGMPEQIFNLAELDADVMYSLLSSDLAQAPGLFEAFYKYNTNVEDKTGLVQELLDKPTNYRLIPEITTQSSGEPFVSVLEKNRSKAAGMVSGLNSEQANIVVGQTYKREMDALANGKKPAITSAQVWGSLPDVVKYDPQVFEEVTSTKGAPLTPSLPGYNKYVNKAKMLKAILKNPEKMADFISAFGDRSFFSDTVFIQKLASGLKEKALGLHDEKQQEAFLKHITHLNDRSINYLAEVKLLKEGSILPAGVTQEEYDKFLKASPRIGKAYSKFQLSIDEKAFVRDSIMKLDIQRFATGVKPEETQKYLDEFYASLTGAKKFNGKKVNVNLDKLFLDQTFVKELFEKTVSSAAVYRFYYGSKNEKGGATYLKPEDIKQALSNFSGALYTKEKEHAEKVTPFSKVTAKTAVTKLEKHESINTAFADSAKLAPKKAEKIVKDIEAGKYTGNKGAEKMDALFKKHGAKICSDKALVTSMLEALEDKAKEEAFQGKKKTELEQNVKATVDVYKPVFDKVVSHYDQQLTQLDKLKLSEEKLVETLQQNADYTTQLAHAQQMEKIDAGMERTK